MFIGWMLIIVTLNGETLHVPVSSEDDCYRVETMLDVSRVYESGCAEVEYPN